jgi:GT2 family glycosyltransferase
MNAAIVITTYNRPQHLDYCLCSLAVQWPVPYACDILVVNDGAADQSQQIVEKYAADGLPVRYLHTNRSDGTWRTMGFSANIGIRQTQGDIVVLSNSDVLHLGTTVEPILDACAADPLALATLGRIFDDTGELFAYLRAGNYADGEFDGIVDKMRDEWLRAKAEHRSRPFDCHPSMPFFMAIRREHLERIGGYDEDMVGIAADDNDLMERLLHQGCHYVYTATEAAHLYHERALACEKLADARYKFNCQMMVARRGQDVRNVGREWGKL